MRYKKMYLVLLSLVLLLFLVTACDNDLVKPQAYLPDNADFQPLFNRDILVSPNGDCYPGYRNYNIRPDRVSLTWEASGDGNFLAYKIYREATLLGTLFEPEVTAWVDSNLVQDTEFTYSVATLVRTGLSLCDTVTVKTASLQPPEVEFRVNSNNMVILRWTDPSDIPGNFKIYRNGNLIADVPEALPATHTRVYTYQDNAVDQFNMYSYQIMKSGTMDATPMSAPLNVFVDYDMDPPHLNPLVQISLEPEVKLEWEDNSQSETGFRVYRRQQGAVDFALVGTVQQPSENIFIDADGALSIGNTYDYYLTAIDTDNSPVYESNPSNTRSITLSENINVEWQVALIDSYGDGWNGGALSVYVNGNAVLANLTLNSGGGPLYFDFEVFDGDGITTDYTTGGWSYENYYAILDHNGAIVAESGGTWNNPGESTPQDITAPIIVDLGGGKTAADFWS